MNPSPDLAGSHLRTYRAVFQHPVSHNLDWRKVRTLLAKLGQVTEEPNGNLKVTRNGQVLVLHPHRTKDVAQPDEIIALRHFLERSEAAAPARAGGEPHWLVVIDHHGARIFRTEMDGAVPRRIVPHEPEDYLRHAHDSGDFSRGREKPDPNGFLELVARALQAGGRILVFGSGKGTSSEMDQFVAWLRHRHPELSGRIIGSLVVDEHHLTEGQLLARAREFYGTARIA